ncbi:MAG: hypothetical protein US24_C0024G0005 [candidate division WS6 bacterium GW2011_GWC2_36_7]|nr:MAG: hypothetical protein US14_C0031G0010 [candidate division WS6 bacterium GW2011_WS6_36_26]KKQ11525.1 MAG: hypothetical protein US24_C0024G0005 [candidate division WS6 bacterium GW2011_GWC2_36_7]KKQ17824.1 MAG: hypothetical protein US29_C0005G0011 [candidate division WS6 bacterium GW2011_GWF1_36_8]
MRSIVRIFLLALITVVVAGVIIKLDYSHALKTVNSDSADKVVVQIEEGETVDQILKSLTDQGLMNERWSNYFKIYLRLNNLAAKLQAGTYNIPKNLNIVELIQTLQNGKDQETWVTIVEGLRKDEIADVLVKNLGGTFSKDTFLALTINQEFINTFGLNSDVKDLEGYLFPDKYAFAFDVTEKDVATILVENFKTKVGVNDRYQTIILASITEKEGRTATDRPIIAGIILKRYNEGWTLGLDTTILYYLKTWDEKVITQEDLKDNNPYNTRVVTGFPPTPICNPGLESINAARNPVNSTYYYFISDRDGLIHYARTAAEHQNNVNQYILN